MSRAGGRAVRYIRRCHRTGGNDRVPDDLLRDTLEKFGDAMSEEEKQALITVYAESGPSADSVTETRGNPGLVLGYRLTASSRSCLQRISAHWFSTARTSCRSADWSRWRCWSGSMAALAATPEPRRRSTTSPSRRMASVSPTGQAGVRALDNSDERFVGRTVTLRPGPYLPEGEMDRFIYRTCAGSHNQLFDSGDGNRAV